MLKNHFIYLICFQIIFILSCGRAGEGEGLPDRATGPFEERLKDGWRVHAVACQPEGTGGVDDGQPGADFLAGYDSNPWADRF